MRDLHDFKNEVKILSAEKMIEESVNTVMEVKTKRYSYLSQ